VKIAQSFSSWMLSTGFDENDLVLLKVLLDLVDDYDLF
jgi:hypothetical protein